MKDGGHGIEGFFFGVCVDPMVEDHQGHLNEYQQQFQARQLYSWTVSSLSQLMETVV